MLYGGIPERLAAIENQDSRCGVITAAIQASRSRKLPFPRVPTLLMGAFVRSCTRSTIFASWSLLSAIPSAKSETGSLVLSVGKSSASILPLHTQLSPLLLPSMRPLTSSMTRLHLICWLLQLYPRSGPVHVHVCWLFLCFWINSCFSSSASSPNSSKFVIKSFLFIYFWFLSTVVVEEKAWDMLERFLRYHWRPKIHIIYCCNSWYFFCKYE